MNEVVAALQALPLLWVLVVAGALVGVLLCALFMNYRLATARARAAGLEDLLADRDRLQEQEQQRYEQLQLQYRELDAQKDDIAGQLAAARSDVSHARQQNELHSDRIQQLETQLRELEAARNTLEKQHISLQADYAYKAQSLEAMRTQFEASREQLGTEFRNLATRIFEEKEQTFSRNSRQSIEGLLQPLREQIDRFQTRVNEVHDQSLQGHSMLRSQIGQLMDMGMKMTHDAQALARALKGDKKALGNWGEMQLESALEAAGLHKGAHFDTQVLFRSEDGRANYPDFIVFLPDGKKIVLDSKVSLVSYEQAVNATEEAARQAFLDAHLRAVRTHIDQLAAKDYTALAGMNSPGFVLMFMPIEGAYIEALRHTQNIFQYGYERGVILVSHTTLMPILRTVSYLWMMADSNEQAQAIGERASDVYNQVARVAEHLSKLGGTIGTLSTHYNAVVRSFAGNQGLTGKVDRFQSLSAKAAKSMPALQPVNAEVDVHRLSGLVEKASATESDPDQDSHSATMHDEFAGDGDYGTCADGVNSAHKSAAAVSAGMSNPMVRDQAEQARQDDRDQKDQRDGQSS
ncbi:DNA recombination protein RmuC [Advenella mimigardefordensis]|uniref:Putative DNA recombination protein RmuC n=1 Tax=Advenella mimigardefordensis (strain DSM 17166 / LMG 22922 / DPN7) TaxID=1247726 RepID=W0PJ49_ADVMD|nr:DNA recombination protein RmuC [Advenella mimigardefordensis]AHG66047.1 putative DNA recombination protein RmuC [Advenella mimigardefordensis DPN7]